MPITALYVLPLALVLIILSFRTIAYRRQHRISLGDDGDRLLLQRMPAHANCAEYTPIALLAMALAESLAAPALILHVIGVTLVTGRVLHAFGMSQSPQIMPLRVRGMVPTLTAIGIASLAAAILSVQRLLA